MPELSKGCKMLAGGVDMAELPLLEPVLEVLHHRHLVGGRVQQDHPQASRHMHHAESNDNVGAGSVAEADAILDPELIEDSHEILAEVLHLGEVEVRRQVLSLVLLTGDVDVDEDGALLDGLEGLVLDDLVPLVMVVADVVHRQEHALAVLVPVGLLEVALLTG